MMRLRHFVQSALCCLLCLTVCGVPALAVKVEPMGGVIISQPETFVITYETYDGMQTLECPFDGVPASFEFVDGTYIYRWNSNMPYDLAYDTVAQAGKVFEVKINVGDGTGSPADVSFDSFSALALATDTADSAWKMNGTCELLIDNVSVWSTTVS